MWLWQKNWGQYPYPLILGWPPSWKICCMMLGLDSLKQWWQAQVGQFFSMGDIQWERAWLQARLEMPHSYSQEQVCGLENSAYLATDLMTIQEGRRAIAQAVSDHWVKVRGPGHPCVNLLAQQPFWFDPPRSSPPKNGSGDGGSDHQPSPHWPSRGQECNRHWRDQRPQSPQFPSPWFESNWSSLSMASLMSSRSDRSDGSRCPRRGRQALRGRSSHEDKPPHLQGWGCQRCSNLPELEVGFNGILMCRVQAWHPPTLCNKILERLSWRVGMELWYRYNIGWCVDNLGWTL